MWTKDQIIILLLITMAIVLTIELAIILIKKRRRKEEMNLFRKSAETTEPLADKAHNAIITTESISSTLARQGMDTSDADAVIRQAKNDLAMKDFTSAIERAESAKLVLLRIKRESRPPEHNAPIADPGRRPMDQSIFKAETEDAPRQEKSLDSLPANYIQSKFMIATTKDILEKKSITDGEAYVLYTAAVNFFEKADYTKALSSAIKAEKLLDSGSLTLIGEEKPSNISEEVIEVLVCPGCEKEISEDDVFCRECGQNLAAAPQCPGCGTDIATTDRFCRKCGTKLKQ
ncbi:MAG: zinc ribbon domain-containing protein [Thermoplasmata archaeon]|nr:zinc ribbon domain-containing protein [Thermoplasmata archaeon]